MVPVQQLAEIAKLMLTNRLLLQVALSEVNVGVGADQHPTLVLDREGAFMAANAIEKNIKTIRSMWHSYMSTPLTPAEIIVANRFATSRGTFIDEALLPAVVSLRTANYEQTKMLAVRAQALYDQAGPALQALNQLHFDMAREAYIHGVNRYENTRLLALGALGMAILIMSWLGLILTMSIVNPLQQVIAIFKSISSGRYDAPITIEGRDEISKVMRSGTWRQSWGGWGGHSQLAFYDPRYLTGLLHDRLQQALSVRARATISRRRADNRSGQFKSINDTVAITSVTSCW
jgi:hypothetical protein